MFKIRRLFSQINPPTRNSVMSDLFSLKLHLWVIIVVRGVVVKTGRAREQVTAYVSEEGHGQASFE